jgi:hypothetical protein
VLCAAHGLNLVVNISSGTINFFGIVQTIYCIRPTFLVNTKKKLPNLTVEFLSDAGWEDGENI